MTTIDVNVRMYHVGFGDCFLLSTTEGGVTHRVLIDCGVHAGSLKTTDDSSFREIVHQVIDDLGPDRHLDIVVITHRHRDHVHGFSYRELWKNVTVGEIWMPWIEDPADPVATGIKTLQDESAHLAYHSLTALSMAFRAAPRKDEASERAEAELDDAIRIVYNSTTNAEAFRQLRDAGGFADPKRKGVRRGPAKIRYLPRNGYQPDRLTSKEIGRHLPHTRVHVLGPSRDPRVIRDLDPPNGAGYLRLLPADPELPSSAGLPPLTPDTPPLPFGQSVCRLPSESGFSETELEEIRAVCIGGMGTPLQMAYRIDNAVNGTSLVLLFEIGDLVLLFPGDAQWGTWKVMLENDDVRKLLGRTNFYKVGHHGSHNATPQEFVQKLLDKKRVKAAMISVAATAYEGGWKEIPKASLVEDLQKKTLVFESNKVPAEQPSNLVRTPMYTEMLLTARVQEHGDG